VVAVSAPIPPPNRAAPGPPPANGQPVGAGSSAAGPFGAGDPTGPLGAGSSAGQGGAAGAVAAVQDSVADLDQLDDLPVADHVARYDALHGTLSEALAAIDGV
jgi:hypothetical protein